MAFDEGEEIQFIERAMAGDAEAFSELFRGYYPMIYSFAYRLCFDKGDAQDVAQETFVKAARSLGRFRRESSFKHWLYQIALNTGHDRNRSQSRRTKMAEEYLVSMETLESPQDHTEVHAALAELPEDLRRAVTLVFFEGMNHGQAARVLGCAETTVSWRIFRAKRRLKNKLGRVG
jgi:RNA polymerase sigma-70 factor (ECF subfamily)